MGLTRFRNAGPFISFAPTPRSPIKCDSRAARFDASGLWGETKTNPRVIAAFRVRGVSVLLISHSPSSSAFETLEEEEDVGRLLSGKRNPLFIRYLPFDFESSVELFLLRFVVAEGIG